MSLVYDELSETPQLHVLIIGVGNYPYLNPENTSTSVHENRLAAYSSITPLTSPPQSAAAFYNLVLHLNNTSQWVRPLGSIHLLISDHPAGGKVLPDVNYAPATFANIRSAYDDWRQRCNTHKKNIALFYFCGHGLQKQAQFLLPEDFGISPLHLWDNAINFNDSRQAFQKCKAETQLFFVDSCRVLLHDMLTTSMTGRNLEDIELPITTAKHDLTLLSASPGESAYGMPNEPSFFTKALINALRGMATECYEESWEVTMNDISKNIHELLDLENLSGEYGQICNMGGSKSTVIVKLNGPPEVHATITCNPEAALGHAELSCSGQNTPIRFFRYPCFQPWELCLEVGIYTLEATFPKGQYNNATKSTVVQPLKPKKVINVT